MLKELIVFEIRGKAQPIYLFPKLQAYIGRLERVWQPPDMGGVKDGAVIISSTYARELRLKSIDLDFECLEYTQNGSKGRDLESRFPKLHEYLNILTDNKNVKMYLINIALAKICESKLKEANSHAQFTRSKSRAPRNSEKQSANRAIERARDYESRLSGTS